MLSELPVDFELLVVDDGSRDDTWSVLSTLVAAHPELTALRLTRNFGKESALAAGLERARGDAVIVMDGDLQHPPELIPQMVEAWRDRGAEVVEAVKIDRGRESGINRWGARLFYALSDWLTGMELDQTTDYKLLDRRVVDHWRELGEHHLFFRGMVAWLGFERVAVPFAVPERPHGSSDFSVTGRLRLAITALTAFSAFPLRLLGLGGFVFLLLSALLGFQTLVRWLSGDALSGFTTVILLLLVVGSAIMIGLGVIGEYVARIYDEVKARPRFIVAESRGGGSGPSPEGDPAAPA